MSSWAEDARGVIRAAIERSGRPKKELAADLGVAESTLHNWLNGRYEPSFTDLGRMAEATGQRIVIQFGDAPAATGSPLGDWGTELERKIDLLLANSGIDPTDAADEEEARRLLQAARDRLARSEPTDV